MATIVVAAVAVLVVAFVAGGVVWWVSAPDGSTDRPPSTVTVERDIEFLPGSRLDVLRPEGDGPWPTAVVIHGCCGGRENTFQLAHALAVRGTLVFNAGWQPTTSGGSYPGVYEEVACAVRFAREWVSGDERPEPLTLVAWSDGALLGSVIAMSDDDAWGDRCPGSATTRPDRFVGVAGFYGWPDPGARADEGRFAADALFGGTPVTAADAWERGNPYAVLGSSATVPMELVVGTEDSLLDDAICFADALEAAGHERTLTVIADAGHLEVLAPRNATGAVVVDVVTDSPPAASAVVDPAGLPSGSCS